MSNTIRTIISVLVCFLICLLAYVRSTQISSATHWYSILPPLLAVVLALTTHRLLLSLAIGIMAGGLLAHVPSNPASPAVWGKGIIAGPGYAVSAVSDPVNMQILVFVALVLAMIYVLLVAGGLQGIVNRLALFARNARSTQFATALMGIAIFIDDYANTMIVGSSMRPMTDKYRVSREKLAFLVDATSAPIAGIAVISTWIGYEVGLFGEVSQSLNMGRTGYSMFFDALGFRFYCILMIVFVLANVLSTRDYGTMRKAEKRARSTGDIAAPNAKPMTSKTFASTQPHEHTRIKARTAIIPIVILFVFLVGALWYDGGGMAQLKSGISSILSLSVWRDVISNAQNNILILAIASAISLVIAIITGRFYGGLKVSILARSVITGIRGSLLPITILVMAWSLKGTCDELQTGTFLVDAVGEILSPLWFPAIVFFIASLTSFATGTSWGTMAILIPTAIPIAYKLDGDLYGLTTMMSLGAVLDGAILGDHCSPISDTTIMSSISSSCDHIHHVYTQLPYSLTVGASALVCGYIPSAFGLPSWISILAGSGVIIAILYVFGRKPTSPPNDSED